ncbi:MAG: DUF3160 domain-containing protein [Anaerolineae bacterium]
MNKVRSPRVLWIVALIALVSVNCSLISLPFGPAETPPTDAPSPTAAPNEEPTPTTAAQEEPAPMATPTASPVDADLPQIPKPMFAIFREEKVETLPSLEMEKVSPGLKNVTIPFVLSEAQLERLATDGFVVSPGTEREFFTLYEKARYRNVPIFVTSDSLLHIYHLLFDKVLRTAEVEFFIPLLRDLNEGLLAETDANYQALRTTPWEDEARRTVAFVAVAGRLLDAGFEVPAYAEDLVEAELTNIEVASGILPSPIFPGLQYGEDYTQYIPRGHYTLSDELKAYFKSMMWYGRMTFRVNPPNTEVGRTETRSALFLVHALRTAEAGGRPALEAWDDLYNPTVFFVGRSDDLTVYQYLAVMDAVYGEDVGVTDLVDEAQLDAFIAMADQLPPPEILGIVIMDTDDEAATTKGLRFMGQRFVPDAYVFRQLIYRNVGTRDNRRGLPKGLDVFAAMGSERAYELLDEMGETSYENYPEQMAKVREWLTTLTVEEWTETLYNTWLYTFYPLMEVPGPGYPTFMTSTAWLDKQLNTVLGSWAELKHDTILYAKQVYAELGGGPPPPPPLPPKGYVEPVPAFYARLAALTTMTREGLESRELLSEQDAESLAQLEDLANALQRMAEKELRGEPLTEEEYERIRYYGGELEHLTMASAVEPGQGDGGFMDETPQAAVIADVATDPGAADGPTVLEVGIGRINELHAIVPVIAEDGSVSLQVAVGGAFSYYEFPWPASDRLTDEAWRERLDEGTAPPVPKWTASFMASSGEYDALQEAVLSFQKSITLAYWDLRESFEGDDALAQFGPEIGELRDANQYMGHQLVSTSFRSHDLQADDLAVVTVRETWQDTLYSYSGDVPTYEDTVVAERGPYTLDVTYTLEAETYSYGTFWHVTQAVYADAAPDW